jgi:hypothetical protein
MDGIGRGKRIFGIISDRIIAITSGKVVIATLAVYVILIVLINGQPFGVAQLKEITGGVGILDLEVLYTPEQAYALLSAMGEAGRLFDLTHIVPLDLVFPFVYSLFDAVLITWLLHRWLPEESRWHRLNVIPIIGGICDYLENIGIITMLLAWPAQLPDIARFTMAAGFFKFTFSALAFAIIFVAILGWAVHAVRVRCASIPVPGLQGK